METAISILVEKWSEYGNRLRKYQSIYPDFGRNPTLDKAIERTESEIFEIKQAIEILQNHSK